MVSIDTMANPQSIREKRLQTVQTSRTLTHWVDKCAPLGEERSEEVLQEKECVEYMKKIQQDGCSKKVLLSYVDLTEEQRSLI
jgi:hypothetical protein